MLCSVTHDEQWICSRPGACQHLLGSSSLLQSAMGSGLPRAFLPGEHNSASSPESVDLGARDPAPHRDGGGLSPRHPVAISLPPTGFVSSSRFKAAFVRSIILLCDEYTPEKESNMVPVCLLCTNLWVGSCFYVRNFLPCSRKEVLFLQCISMIYLNEHDHFWICAKNRDVADVQRCL